MIELKQKILNELSSTLFPDLKFIYSDKVLDVSLEILEELLENEKKDFEDLLKLPKDQLTFDSFEDDSLLDYFWHLLHHLKMVNSSEKVRKIIEIFRDKMDNFWNYVAYNKNYFDQLKYVNDNCTLDTEQTRIMYLRLKSFVDRWINLSTKDKQRLKEINIALSKLSEKFSDNILDDEALFEYFIDDFEIIKNLPKEVIKNAEEKAKQKKKNWYIFDSDPTSYQAIMNYCDSEIVRKDFESFKISTASSWKFDNRPVILDILKLKKEKSIILWYKNYAELSFNSKMADSPEQIISLIEWISKKAKFKAIKELEELKEYHNITKINSYDFSYYSRIYKEEKFELDEKKVKEYFDFNNTLDYLFNFTEKFYWIKMSKLDINAYNKDVLVYEVYKDNVLIAYYILDPFFDKTKESWAWSWYLRWKTYHLQNNKIPIYVNVCNFQKTTWNTTLYLREVETIFHEFWHSLHKILSESKYSELSWNEVEWDFVELPSQLLENWVTDSESISKLAKHYKTNDKIPKDLIKKIDNLKSYMSWNAILAQNSYTFIDLKIFMYDKWFNFEELDKFILSIANNNTLFRRDKNYKPHASFDHVFWWWYSAWFYSYMRAEILEADVFERIKEMWMFERNTWEHFIKTLLWQGTRKKASELFYDFMWREVNDSAFLKRKWLY